MKEKQATYWIERLGMIPHPEGGYCREMYRPDRWTRELSDQEEGQLQVTIEPDIWFAAQLKKPEGYALVSCAVAPGFEYKDFELARREELLNLYPDDAEVIKRLTR